MPSIPGVRRGNLVHLKPENLVIDLTKNYSRPETADYGDLGSMTQSILAGGIGVPITVVSIRDGKTTKKAANGDQLWEVVKGFRRALGSVEAAKLGWKGDVPATIFEGDDLKRLLDNAVENEMRQDMSPLGRMAVYTALSGHGLTSEAIAKSVGRVPDFVRDHIKLASAAPEVRDWLRQDKISFANVRLLLRIADHKGQVEALPKLAGYTVIEARKAMHNAKEHGTISLVPPPLDLGEDSTTGDLDEDEENTTGGETAVAPVKKKPTKKKTPERPTITVRHIEMWVDAKIERLAARTDRSELQDGELRAYRALIKEIDSVRGE